MLMSCSFILTSSTQLLIVQPAFLLFQLLCLCGSPLDYLQACPGLSPPGLFPCALSLDSLPGLFPCALSLGSLSARQGLGFCIPIQWCSAFCRSPKFVQPTSETQTGCWCVVVTHKRPLSLTAIWQVSKLTSLHSSSALTKRFCRWRPLSKCQHPV